MVHNEYLNVVLIPSSFVCFISLFIHHQNTSKHLHMVLYRTIYGFIVIIHQWYSPKESFPGALANLFCCGSTLIMRAFLSRTG